MPPKTETKGFRKQKGKAKGKAKKKQVVYVRAKQSQPTRILPAFSVAPQGFPGGVVQTPGIVVSPQISLKPETIPDNTNQILASYNNLLLQGAQAAQAAQAQRFQEYRNQGGLNIQRPESGFRTSTSESALLGKYTEPSNYYRAVPSITEQAVDDLTYDNPRINDVIANELDYAPQLPDVSSSSSTRGFTLEEKQDNALSNLVAKEQLGKQEKQVESDLNNTNEKDQNEEVWFDIIPEQKRTNKKKLPVQSSSADAITEYSLEPPIVLTPAEKRRQTIQKKKAADFSAKSEQTRREWDAFMAAEGNVAVNPFNLPSVRLTSAEAGKPYTFV